ncbi:hypothetical protein, partial [Pseudomonas guariconensis]|uniref:hypothetical protein n=1 Tax=Pseudomonas guariconensis TaxID=1288410 RepID=UPI0039E781A1
MKPDGKGMETGAWIAKNATQYNFLNHERTEYLVEDNLNRPCFPRHSPSSENSVSHTLLATA